MSTVVKSLSNKQAERKIKDFLSKVLYIDDEFSLSLVNKENQSNPSEDVNSNDEESYYAALSEACQTQQHTSAAIDVYTPISEIHESMEDTSYVDESNLELLLENLQQNYKNIIIFPYKYNSHTKTKDLVEHIQCSNFTIIDWQLKPGLTAVNVLKDVICTEDQMRLIVVYTQNFNEAENDFKDNFDDMIFYDGKTESNKNYKYTIHNSSLIMLCSKVSTDSFDIEEIIDTFASLLVEQYGYFPVVFFDTILELNKKTGKLLKKFSQPFETLLILQSQSQGYNYNDLPKELTSLITNHINEEIVVNENIINAIYSSINNNIHKLQELDKSTLDKKIKEVIALLEKKHKKEKEYKHNLEALSQIDVSLFKECINIIDLSPAKWEESLNLIVTKISDDFITKRIMIYINKLELLNKIDSPDKESIIKELIDNTDKVIKNEYVKWLKEVLPILFTMLSNDNITNSISQLIGTLKLTSYENNDLTNLSDLIIFKDNNKIILEETKVNLKNFFHSGDIIIDCNEINMKNDTYLLCITPPCDVFRPERVDFKLNFIKGKVHSDIPERKHLRENQHVTIIPDHRTKKLVPIVWNFYDIQIFDLKCKEEINRLITCKRPYRLNNNYIRQIIGKYIAFYSRVGVDEIFIKNSQSYGNIFIG
ncbi:response regulator receiver domain [Proteiniborus sp. MB09-C3]|uniref:response regulator receiver domain n=1 Tax=Proteiniborus sp. MB09-C3 TaxID=3050072 RepID=UPI002552DE87|nr:response regulator receiver domain [Proteiniborus sp. MB09-C3]WIV11085.1 response regulator receiver domain [Proteiniborus sp. MB09-C3]